MTRFRSVMLVGAGAMAEREHLPRIRTILRPEQIVLVEPSSNRREEIKKRLGNGESIVATVESDRQFDLIVIASPPATHCQCFHHYSSQSQCFLIEKPLCLSSEDALSIIQAHREKSIKAVVCLPRRKFRHFRLLREFIQSQRFGELQRCSLNEGRVFAWHASNAYFVRKLSGGGVLADIGPHAVDQLHQLFSQLEVDFCEMDCDPGCIDANVLVQFSTKQRQPIRLCLSRNRYLSDTISLEFKEATVTAALRQEKLFFQFPDGEYTMEPSNPRDFSRALDLVYQEAILTDDEFCGMYPADSLPSVKLIEQCYLQARNTLQDWSFAK